MSDEYSQPTLELSRTFEGWWLPRRPLCCDDDYAALRRRSRADALRCKHIEANPSALVNTIVVDIDDANAKAMALWGHRGMLPNWIAENPANGPSGYQPPSYEPVNPERRTPQTPSDGLI